MAIGVITFVIATPSSSAFFLSVNSLPMPSLNATTPSAMFFNALPIFFVERIPSSTSVGENTEKSKPISLPSKPFSLFSDLPAILPNASFIAAITVVRLVTLSMLTLDSSQNFNAFAI